MRPRITKNPNLPAAFEGMKSDYAAAKSSRFRRIRTGIAGMGSGADYHYRNETDHLRVMEYARDMDRNDAIIGHMLDTAALNIVQEGMWPDPQTGDNEADKILLDLFWQWGSDSLQCSIDGTKTWADQQELVLRSVDMDGDIFALPTDTGALQMVEAHRCRTPSGTKRNVVLGVLLDDLRRRIEYWFTKDDIDPHLSLSKVGDIDPRPAFDGDGNPLVLHIFDPKRFSQTRGVSVLAPIFDTAGMFEDITFAKMVQQQVVSCFCYIRTRENSGDSAPDPRLGNQEVDTYSDAARKIIEQIAPGMEISGNPGESIEGFSPNVPNPGAMEHLRMMLTLMGLRLGLPLVLLLMDASETNFSGWRGAVDQARMGFRRRQRWLIDHFLAPVYRWKVRQWTAPGTGDKRLIELAAKLRASGGDIFAHTWTAPKWPYIEPFKDAQADALRVEKRQTSPRRQLAERGLDIDDIRSEIVADNKALILICKRAAEEINQEYPNDPINWRTLLHVANETDMKPGLPGSPNTIEAAEGGAFNA
jgi:lambda family phage portal protein